MSHFFIVIRSCVFNGLFAVTNLIMCIAFLWALALPHRMTFRVVMIYFRFVAWLERHSLGLDYIVEGAEHIPPPGQSYIIAMKHQSLYETFKVFMIFGYAAIIMKRELGLIPLWGWYARKTRMIFINRGAKSAAIQSLLKNAGPVVDEGRPILIYPQGTRVAIGETVATKPYKQGGIRLYEHYNLPILPVAVNSGLFWPKGSFIKKPGTVTFKIMPPIEPGLDGRTVLSRLQDVIETESNILADNPAVRRRQN